MWSIQTGMRSEIVSELGRRFGKLAFWAVDQSKLAPSVAGMAGTAERAETLASVRFIGGSFRAVHGTGGDHPQLGGSKGKIKVEEAACVGAAQGAESRFGLRMFGIRSDDERLIKKDLFGFATGDVGLGNVLGDVSRIPVEAVKFGRIEGHRS